ncbi:MAG: hypothetical protein ABII85_01475 [Bacillota bacterium]
MAKLLDTYLQWQADGILDEKLKTIQELVSKRILQKDISEVIGISERTLIKLKRAHPRLNQAFINGDDELKYKVFDALYQRAVGGDYEESQTIIEETKTGTKKRIVKTKKKVQPDVSAIKYLLLIKFGKEYNERREEIDIMLKRLEKGEEIWTNEYSDEENSGVIRVRKQSKK